MRKEELKTWLNEAFNRLHDYYEELIEEALVNGRDLQAKEYKEELDVAMEAARKIDKKIK